MLTTDVIPLIIPSGSASGSIRQAIEPGRVIGLAIISKGGANTGMVRAKIRDNKGNDIVRLQPIEVLKQRDSAFYESFYPTNFESNSQTIEFEIIATANFTSDLVADLVIFYNC